MGILVFRPVLRHTIVPRLMALIVLLLQKLRLNQLGVYCLVGISAFYNCRS